MENAEELAELKNIIEQLRKQTSNQSKHITDTIIMHINEKFENLNLRQNQIESPLTKQESRIDNIDRQLRMRNIIIQGVEEEEKGYFELELLVQNVLKQIIGMEIKIEEIDFARRIGQKSTNKTRPILVGLLTWRVKLLILKNRRQSNSKTMYITEDFPTKVLEIRKNLKKQQEEEQKAGNIAFIRYDKLIVKTASSNNNPNKSNTPNQQSSSSLQQTHQVRKQEENRIAQKRLPSSSPTGGDTAYISTNSSRPRVINSNKQSRTSNSKNTPIFKFFSGRESTSALSDSELLQYAPRNGHRIDSN